MRKDLVSNFALKDLERELERTEATIQRLAPAWEGLTRSMDFYVGYVEALRAEVALRKSCREINKPVRTKITMSLKKKKVA